MAVREAIYIWQGPPTDAAKDQQANDKSESKHQTYRSFLRIGAVLPEDTIQRRKNKKQPPAAAGQEPVVPQLRFSVGDGVVVACHGNSIGIGILTDLWEEPNEEDEDEDEDDEKVKRCRVRWCYRRQDLPNTTSRQIQLVDHELLYASEQTRGPVTSDLPLSSLIHTCAIIESSRFKDLYPMYHSSWSHSWKMEIDDDASDDDDDEDGNDDKEQSTGEAALIALAKRIPASLNLALSNTSFNAHKRAVPLVYFCDKAFDKFGKGGKGKSWWTIDWPAVAERGAETGDWKVLAPEPSVTVMEMDRAEESDGSASESEFETGSADEVDEDMMGAVEDQGVTAGEIEAAPRKRRGRPPKNPKADSAASKPGRKRKSSAQATATLRKRIKSEATSQALHRTKRQKRAHNMAAPRGITAEIATELLPRDPYERALHLLHVGATPDSLPCREDEFIDVMTRVESGIESGGGGCLYISGVPGTGKTATVHAVIKELTRKAEEGDLPPFSYVEINGLKVPTPQHAYVTLWEAISGQQRVSSTKVALRGLEEHFSERRGASGPRGHTFVVLMDELDQLLTAKQDVVYNFFNWPALRDSQLFVIAVANRMDLPQQLAAKVKSRLGLQSLLFQPYDKPALVEIVQSRLIPHPDSQEDHKILSAEAIELAAAKMAGTNGDARRVLDACRRAVEVSMETAKQTRTPRKPVTIREMSAVLRAMTSSPIALYIKQCSLHQKMMLAAMLRCVRREGVSEIPWRSVRADHDNLIRAICDSNDILNNAELSLVFSSLIASHALTCSHERHKHMDDRKVAMGMDSNEVGRVLMAEGDRWNQILAGM